MIPIRSAILLKVSRWLLGIDLVVFLCSTVCISTITEAELLRGVEKKPEAKKLFTAVHEFLLRVEILPWDSKAAKSYAQLRTLCEKEGKSLGAMDMLIAAHSVSVGATLITNDLAFYNVKHHILLEDWTIT